MKNSTALRFLNLVQKTFSEKTFSVSLKTVNSSLVEVSKEAGHVLFSYKIPEEVCCPKTGRLPISSAIAIMDELSTYSFLIKDRTCRSGVSIHLAATLLDDSYAGDEILIKSKADKIGKNVGYCSIEIREPKTQRLLVRGTHIKYLAMGFVWENIIAHPRILPLMISFHENYGRKVSTHAHHSHNKQIIFLIIIIHYSLSPFLYLQLLS